MDRTIKRVLVANRGEIAVRIIRAAKDVGITSVAVYADSDSEGLFVKLADEAFALNGVTPAQTYLCLLYTSPSPRDRQKSRMPSSA